MYLVYSSSNTSGKKNLEAKIYKTTNDDEEFVYKIELSGTPQWIIFMFYHNDVDPEVHIYELKGVDISDTIQLNHLLQKKDVDFIYAINTELYAKAFREMVPKHKGLTIYNKNNVTMVKHKYSANLMLYQRTGATKYLMDGYPTEIPHGKVVQHYTTLQDLTTLQIRDSLAPTGCYQDLTYDEKRDYVPYNVEDKPTINWRTNTVWELATQHSYKGSLTYVPTRDKDLHFIDDNGQKHRYNLELARELVPFIVRGKVTGVFTYRPRGSRNISYVLVPQSVSADEGLQLCDSDDSDLELEI